MRAHEPYTRASGAMAAAPSYPGEQALRAVSSRACLLPATPAPPAVW